MSCIGGGLDQFKRENQTGYVPLSTDPGYLKGFRPFYKGPHLELSVLFMW